MTGPDDDEGEGFADLFGPSRPLKPSVDRAKLPRSTPGVPGRTPAESSPETRFRFPDPDQPRLAAASGVNDRQLRDLAQGRFEPEERVEMHGIRADAARRTLLPRIESACSRGLRCIVVIHGRGRHSNSGEAVLRDAIPDWLSNAPIGYFVLAFAPAPPGLGGDGATLVLLRRMRSDSNRAPGVA